LFSLPKIPEPYPPLDRSLLKEAVNKGGGKQTKEEVNAWVVFAPQNPRTISATRQEPG